MATAFRKLPAQERIKYYYDYNKETGEFTFKTGARKGKVAGCKRTRRGGKPWLVLIYVENVQYPAHRLAWRWMTGEDPQLSIDHIDQDPFNNAWSNLRLADDFTQANNRTYPSKHPGVNFHKVTGKWTARIQRNNERVYLGLFDTKQAAIVYREAVLSTYETY
jgi:hypothetical protein